jgi:DNA-binding LacI/PurR family transcriptional regulator
MNTVCTEAGVALPVVRRIDYQDDSGRSAAAAWKEAGVTAVIAYNDDTAADVIAGAVRNRIRVPEDLSVVGHDDSPLAVRFMPSITSISIDLEQLGQYTAGIALHYAEGHPLPDAPTEAALIVPRESAAPRLGGPVTSP